MEEELVTQPILEDQQEQLQEQSYGPKDPKIEMTIEQYANYVYLQELQVRELTAIIDLHKKTLELNEIRQNQNQ